MATINKTDDKTQILIATDIFGMGPHLERFVLNANIQDRVVIVSPYSMVDERFENEQQAYLGFKQVGGIEGYINKLVKLIEVMPNIEYLVGFSAGGAALYKIMSSHFNQKTPLFLFYPSQIRHFFQPTPRGQCEIVFPASEPHFAVNEIIDKLSVVKNINITQSQCGHGFMNPLSNQFNQLEYLHYCQVLAEKVLSAVAVDKT